MSERSAGQGRVVARRRPAGRLRHRTLGRALGHRFGELVGRVLGRRSGRSSRPPPASVAAAELAHRAAAALRGGMPAARVAAMLTGSDQVAGDAAERDAPEWRVLLAAWRLAERSGAPFAPTLDRFCGAMRALGRVAERREVLLAGP